MPAHPPECQIAVRVTPRSARPGIGGWRDLGEGRRELEVRVAAAPADGAANAQLVALLAKALGLPKGSVVIRSGATSRHKRVAVALSAEEAERRLRTG